jgi:endonuclease-8
VAEGPQVKRTAEWLHKHLARTVLHGCDTTRDEFDAQRLVDRQLVQAFCKGKHIFLELEGDLFIHNHLLMRGRWKKIEGQLLFLPFDAWLALYVGPYTVCNFRGQMLRLVGPDQVRDQLKQLGPDAMAEPYPRLDIEARLRGSGLPIAESLLDQSLVAGIGNIAKSEILFSAQVAPHVPASNLNDSQMATLLDAIHEVLWQSYHRGGRWNTSVYQKRGRPCPVCETVLERTALAPSRRNTYFCPRCQR